MRGSVRQRHPKHAHKNSLFYRSQFIDWKNTQHARSPGADVLNPCPVAGIMKVSSPYSMRLARHCMLNTLAPAEPVLGVSGLNKYCSARTAHIHHTRHINEHKSSFILKKQSTRRITHISNRALCATALPALLYCRCPLLVLARGGMQHRS